STLDSTAVAYGNGKPRGDDTPGLRGQVTIGERGRLGDQPRSHARRDGLRHEAWAAAGQLRRLRQVVRRARALTSLERSGGAGTVQPDRFTAEVPDLRRRGGVVQRRGRIVVVSGERG